MTRPRDVITAWPAGTAHQSRSRNQNRPRPPSFVEGGRGLLRHAGVGWHPELGPAGALPCRAQPKVRGAVMSSQKHLTGRISRAPHTRGAIEPLLQTRHDRGSIPTRARDRPQRPRSTGIPSAGQMPAEFQGCWPLSNPRPSPRPPGRGRRWWGTAVRIAGPGDVSAVPPGGLFGRPGSRGRLSVVGEKVRAPSRKEGERPCPETRTTSITLLLCWMPVRPCRT